MIQAAVSSTFHGRDIFSPAAAHLSAGWDYNLVGPAVPQLVRLTSKTAVVSDKGVTGDLIGLDDPFGSVITDITRDDFTKLGYVVGDQASYLQVHIPTGSILAEIASDMGYKHVRTDLFRTRIATATRQQMREEVVVLRWES